MKGRILEWVLLALGFALVAILGIAREQRSEVEVSSFSTDDTGPNGYRAWYEVLRSEGLTVRRFEQPLGLLDPGIGTVVISSNEYDGRAGRVPTGFSRGEIARLVRFVRGGGRLVSLDTSYGDSDDAAFAIPKSKDLGHALLAARAIGANSFVAGVSRVELSATASFTKPKKPIVQLLQSGGKPLAIAYGLGKGQVIAVLAPDVASNRVLAREQNARFAYDLVAGNGPIAFDERIHGYSQQKGFWEALPPPTRAAFWVALVILLLWLVDANVRFAPTLPLDPPDERDSSAYVVSMAALLRRARAGRAAVARFADDAMRLARRRFGLGPNSDLAAISMRADRDDVRKRLAELQRIHAIERPDDAALLRAARLNAALRKDLT